MLPRQVGEKRAPQSSELIFNSPCCSLLPFSSSGLTLLLLAWEVHRKIPDSLNVPYPSGDTAVG